MHGGTLDGFRRAWLLEAAGYAQRPLRIDESESGVEIEPAGIIDRMRPDVASEMARLPF